MSDVIDRIRVICQIEKLSREDLASKTGMNYTRWHNLMNNRGVIRPEELLMVGEAFPKYKHWIVFGEELPKSGQVSPMSERDRLIQISNLENLKNTRGLDTDDEWELEELRKGMTRTEFVEVKMERNRKRRAEIDPPWPQTSDAKD